MRVDLDGLAERAVVVPVPVGLHSDLRAVQGRPALAHPPDHRRDRRRPARGRRAAPSDAVALGLRRRAAARTIVDALDWYRPSGDGTRIVVRDGDTLRVGPADHAVQARPDDDGAEANSSRSTSTASRCAYDPPAQWRQMMAETWRLMRDHFWIEDMGGVDWDDVLERYLPLVDRIATRDDLSEVLWEMIGELGSSHAYERHRATRRRRTAAPRPSSAPTSTRDADGRWVIARVLPGESSVPAARSPLRAAGADVRDGDVLVAVNGQPVGPVGPAPLLAGLAGKPVALTVARDGTDAHRGRRPDRRRDPDPLPGLGVRPARRRARAPATAGSATSTCRT